MRLKSVIVAGASLAFALAGQAFAGAKPAQALQPATAVVGRAHLIYRTDPHARPIEGQVTVLEPAAAAAAARDAAAPQVQITLFQIAQR